MKAALLLAILACGVGLYGYNTYLAQRASTAGDRQWYAERATEAARQCQDPNQDEVGRELACKAWAKLSEQAR